MSSSESSLRWYSWGYWVPAKTAVLEPDAAGTSSQSTPPVVVENAPSSSTVPVVPEEVEPFTVPSTGWERIKALYENPSMETDVVQRVARMTFMGGFLLGGSSGYLQAAKTFEVNNVGRKYLSPSDSVKRRVDYAILRFAKAGVGMGMKCAFISGAIVLATTHLAAYRNRFSSWYFPALSGVLACTLHTASLGAVFAFPVGVVGSMKACGLGITSGLTLAAVVHLYALGVDKSVNDSYWHFKKEYEKELYTTAEWEHRVQELMKAENIRWRQTAVKKLKEQDDARLRSQDD